MLTKRSIEVFGRLVEDGSMKTISQAALQQAGIMMGFSSAKVARLTNVSRRTVWLATAATSGSGRRKWHDRSVDEQNAAINEMKKRANV
jgi:hypothetical protein